MSGVAGTVKETRRAIPTKNELVPASVIARSLVIPPASEIVRPETVRPPLDTGRFTEAGVQTCMRGEPPRAATRGDGDGIGPQTTPSHENHARFAPPEDTGLRPGGTIHPWKYWAHERQRRIIVPSSLLEFDLSYENIVYFGLLRLHGGRDDCIPSQASLGSLPNANPQYGYMHRLKNATSQHTPDRNSPPTRRKPHQQNTEPTAALSALRRRPYNRLPS